ncbi:hypothetical protein BRW64_02510 [Mycolicibacterium diernhoferi]|nr:hypothetical protein BRW64_02510 [Mycolicibacterium diernhoferi]
MPFSAVNDQHVDARADVSASAVSGAEFMTTAVALGRTNQGPSAPALPSNPLAEALYALFRRIQTTFFNSSPIASPSQDPGQSAVGVVTGDVGENDPDGDPLVVALKTGPTKGSVIVNSDGTYTYTPSQALAGTGGTDTFTVTIAETNAAEHIHGFNGFINRLLGKNDGSTITKDVTVTISPVVPTDNGAPVVGDPAYSIDRLDPSTGQVTGSLHVTDPDGDRLTYTLNSPPSVKEGRVIIDINTGDWTFTPSTTALMSAWDKNAPKVVPFGITASDGEKSVIVTIVATVVPSRDALINSIEYTGSRPSGVAVAPDGRIYVINEGAHTLSFFDPTSGEPTTVRVGHSPGAIAIDGRGHVWVTNTGDGTVSVFTAAGAPIRTLSVGTTPVGIGISDTTVFVANFADDTVSIVDPDDYSIRTISSAGANPIGIAIGADGTAYVSNFGSSTIAVIDPQTHEVTQTIGTGVTHPYGIAVDGNGILFVTHPLSETVSVLTPERIGDARAQVGKFVGQTAVAVSQSGRAYTLRRTTVLGSPTAVSIGAGGKVYITNADGATITVLEPLSLAASVIRTGPNPTSVYHDGGSKLYVTSGTDNTVQVIDTNTHVVQTVKVGVATSSVIVEDGNLVITDTDGATATVSVVAGSAKEPLTATVIQSDSTRAGETLPQMVVSPNGDRMYVTSTVAVPGGMSNGLTYVKVIDTRTNTVIAEIPIGDRVSYYEGSMAISPDGHYVYVTHQTAGHVPDNLDAFSGIQEVLSTGRVEVIDTHSKSVVDSIVLGINVEPIQIAVSADGKRLFIAGSHPHAVRLDTRELVDPLTLAPITGPGIPGWPEAVVWVVDIDSRAVVKSSIVRIDSEINNLAVSPDGTTLYIIAGGPGETSGQQKYYFAAVDVDTSETLAFEHLQWTDRGASLAVTRDGLRVYLPDGHVFNPSDKSLSRFSQIGGDLVLSPDDTRLYQVAWTPASVTLTAFDTETGGVIDSVSLGIQEATDIAVSEKGSLFVLGGIRRGDPAVNMGPAPTSVEDLWTNLKDYTNDSNGGTFIQTVRDANNKVRLIVYVGGTTDDFWAGNQAITENIPAELHVAKGDQVAAINDALEYCRANTSGCNSIDEIMIVGYSQGGIDAQNLASRGGFAAPITTIITFGSPIVSNPAVTTLHIQDDWDEVVNAEALVRFGLALAPTPPWLKLMLVGPRIAALSKIYRGDSPTSLNITNAFSVHGDPETYRWLGEQFGATHTGAFSAQKSAMSRFLGGAVIDPLRERGPGASNL